MTIYSWAGFSASTDLGATTGFTRQSGNSGSIAVNSNHNLDFVTSSPNSLYTCDESSADCSFEVTLVGSSGTGGNFFPCCVRVNDINNLIGARITSANNIELFKYVAGTANQLGSSIAITGRATGDKIKVSAVGNTITAYYNSVQKIQVTETFNNTQTKMGMFARSSTINNFISGAVSLNLGVAISSINSGNGVSAGSTGNTIIFTGSYSLTALTIGNISAVNISGSGISWTFDLPAIIDNTTSQNFGSKTATASNGATNLTLSTQWLPPTGYSYIEIGSLINQTVTGTVYLFNPAAAQFDQIATRSPETPETNTSDASTTITGKQTGYHWSLSTNKIYTFDLITGGDNPYALLKQNLTSSSITSATITQK